MATMKDVAERAGVSIPVVSAYISGSKTVRMSEETRRRVGAAIEDVGYVPNLAARSLRTQRTNVLAVVVPKLDNPVLSEMLRGIYDAAGESGYAIMLADAAQLTSGSRMLEHFLAQGTVDGVLIRRSGSLREPVVNALESRKLPVVFLDDESGTEHHWLAPDDGNGIRAATEHLIDAGHRRIGFLGGPDVDYVRLRYAAYVAAVEARGIAALPAVHCGQSPDDGYQAFAGYIAGQPRDELPTALVVNNTSTGLGVLAAAHDAGLSVPDDLAIVGYHEVPLAGLVRPALTPVKMPLYELGIAGVAMLDDAINRRDVESRVFVDISPEIIVRESAPGHQK
jgi:DNA-binding LacI/PurR family transcriptional regulator